MATVAILMSAKIDSKTKVLPEIKRNPSWRWNGQIYYKDKVIINRAPNYMKQNLDN